MSDLAIAVIGVVVSFVAAIALWYWVEDERERQWHAEQLKRKWGK